MAVSYSNVWVYLVARGVKQGLNKHETKGGKVKSKKLKVKKPRNLRTLGHGTKFGRQ